MVAITNPAGHPNVDLKNLYGWLVRWTSTKTYHESSWSEKWGSERFMAYCPKNPDPSKVAILRTRAPAIRVQTLPLKDPKILRVEIFPEYNCLEPQMGPHVLEDLTHKMEGETPQKRGQLGFRWVVFHPAIYRAANQGELVSLFNCSDLHFSGIPP